MSIILLLLFKISLVVFMAGNLLEMGLKLDPGDALKGFRNLKFVLAVLISGFLIGPALAIGITKILPLDQHYAMGLLLLGMAPSAPFLPMLMQRAGGDLGYTAAFMILASVGTIIFMPLFVPILIKGLSVSAWDIARPLILVVLLPMVIGMAILHYSRKTATVMHPLVRKVTFLFTLFTLIFSLLIYGKGLMGTPGSFAILAQIIFFAAITIFSYAVGSILEDEQRKVLSIGMCTRNLGASLAPLLSAGDDDQRATIMVFLGLFIMTGSALFVSRVLGSKTLKPG